ncbi:MAG TPA: ABC transporter permease, partial [Flavisolibacter sp.]
MLTHLVRLIWNKKGQNFLLIMEIFFSFLGLFAGFTFVLYPYNNYKLPIGLDHENVWIVNTAAVTESSSRDSLQLFREALKRELRSMNGISDVGFSSGNIPFSGNASNTDIHYGDKETWANYYTVEDNYAKILGVKLLQGRWFLPEDRGSKDRPAVINESLKKELFGDEDPLGKRIGTEAIDKMKVVGVVADFKHESEDEVPPP